MVTNDEVLLFVVFILAFKKFLNIIDIFLLRIPFSVSLIPNLTLFMSLTIIVDQTEFTFLFSIKLTERILYLSFLLNFFSSSSMTSYWSRSFLTRILMAGVGLFCLISLTDSRHFSAFRSELDLSLS